MILTNHTDGWRLVQDVEHAILRRYAGVALTPNQPIGHRGVNEAMTFHSQPLATQPPLGEYVGTYRRPPVGTVEVRGRPAARLVVSTGNQQTGTTITIFSIVDGVLLKPFPYADPDRLRVLGLQNVKQERYDDPGAVPRPEGLEAASTSFESIAIVTFARSRCPRAAASPSATRPRSSAGICFRCSASAGQWADVHSRPGRAGRWRSGPHQSHALATPLSTGPEHRRPQGPGGREAGGRSSA